LNSARSYQRATQRGGLGTDYITTGAKLQKNGAVMTRDEIICIQNIDDRNITATPTIEIFSSKGFAASVSLGELPGFACRTYLLSELFSGTFGSDDLTLRLVDERATMVMSIVHLDHIRRDIALDHGSDRFSTFFEFDCKTA
jgi:hypothetical protein